MSATLAEILSSLGSFLRYVASGFVGWILFVALADKLCPEQRKLVSDAANWFAPLSACLLGMLTYSVHTHVILPVFWWLTIHAAFRGRNSRRVMGVDESPQPIFDERGVIRKSAESSLFAWVWAWTWDFKLVRALRKGADSPPHLWDNDGKNAILVFHKLAHQTLLRRASGCEDVRRLQTEIDRWTALINFTFCSGYQFLVIPVVLYSTNLGSLNRGDVLRWMLVGVFLICSAQSASIRSTIALVLIALNQQDGIQPANTTEAPPGTPTSPPTQTT